MTNKISIIDIKIAFFRKFAGLKAAKIPIYIARIGVDMRFLVKKRQFAAD